MDVVMDASPLLLMRRRLLKLRSIHVSVVVVTRRRAADLRRTERHRQRTVAVRVAGAATPAAAAAATHSLAEAVLCLVEVLVASVIVVVVADGAAGVRPSTPTPLAHVARRLLALVEDGGEDEHVEEQQAAADCHRDAERH